jgi:acetyl esterase/lipase
VTISRRALLGVGATASVLAGCGEAAVRPVKAKRIHYGPHPQQYADLRRPSGKPVGTLVLLHGGYWMPGYHLDQLDSIATLMTRSGWATWNVEYRPIGTQGRWPDPMTDVALAVDHLLEEDLAARVVLLGHSAGGQLAVWAASRTGRTPGGPPRVRPVGAISLSGVLDLAKAAAAPGSSGPVIAFAGGTPTEVPEHYRLSDPALLTSAVCPVWAVHAEDDTVVPAEQATSYVSHAVAAGGQAELVNVPGDHFTLIDTRAPSFPTIRKLVDRVGA